MKSNLVKDILWLSFAKKNFNQRILYLFKGLVFAPFLIREERKQKRKGTSASDIGLAGDDVYPLF